MSTQAVALTGNPVQLKVGDLVVVPEKTNSVWAGNGVVASSPEPFIPGGPNYVNVKLTTGRMAGREGGFRAASLELVTCHGFSQGQRVTNQFGQSGVVNGVTGAYVRVLRDGDNYATGWL